MLELFSDPALSTSSLQVDVDGGEEIAQKQSFLGYVEIQLFHMVQRGFV